MVLLLQLHGDLPEFFPGHERRLYVLSCRRSTCRRKEGSVRAIRGVRVTNVPEKESKKEAEQESRDTVKKPVLLGNMLFGANPFNSSTTNPFPTSTSTASNSLTASSSESSISFPPLPTQTIPKTAENPPMSDSVLTESFATKVSLHNPLIGPPPPSEPWPVEDKLPKPYTHYHIGDADYEVLDKELNRIPIPQATEVMDLDENEAGSLNQKEDKVVYEDVGDAVFQKFADRLGQNPEQVIRYEFKGQPLLYSKTDNVGQMFHAQTGKITTSSGSRQSSRSPRCGNCGAARVFEVQLCPYAISELEVEEEGIDGMEWTVIAVVVCEKDCTPQGMNPGEAGYVEEAALVQWEEVAKPKGR